MLKLDEKKVKIVDTTCPWVSKVWNTVDKHRKLESTSIILGNIDSSSFMYSFDVCFSFLEAGKMTRTHEKNAWTGRKNT